MCDLIFDIITCCVRSCDMGKISVYDKNHQKNRNMDIKEILHKSPFKRSSTNGIHSLLKRADARESAGIIYFTTTRSQQTTIM